ncbi:MAG: hypothetical protein SNJ77_06205 [Cytophagales bacterium]
METLTKISRTLNVPLHEFLPETFQINNNNHHGQGGLIFGNFYYYSNPTERIQELEKENERLRNEIETLKNLER